MFGLGHVRIETHFTILDVGCGGGRTIQKLAVSTEGIVLGIDYAAGSVAASRGMNDHLVKAGRVKILRADVSHLPFSKDQFDLVISVESQYYWPDLIKDTEGILRVLRPGGRLLVIAESYKGGKYDLLHARRCGC
jgi:SAM-dependent methyltransferase